VSQPIFYLYTIVCEFSHQFFGFDQCDFDDKVLGEKINTKGEDYEKKKASVYLAH